MTEENGEDENVNMKEVWYQSLKTQFPNMDDNILLFLVEVYCQSPEGFSKYCDDLRADPIRFKGKDITRPEDLTYESTSEQLREWERERLNNDLQFICEDA